MITARRNSAAQIANRFINSTHRHVFLTGKAGTGKTTFLKDIVETNHKNTIVAAPTGIAAINAGGVTLHSLFHLPFGTFIPSDDPIRESTISIQLITPKSLIEGLKMNRMKRNLLKEMELLIIDEVSMLRADLLDAIDVLLRSIRRQKSIPFGGVQILFIGDLLQLPPVVREEEWAFLSPYYQSIFFFQARALQNNKPLYIELEKIFRQTDKQFISILNNFRDNTVSKKDIEILNRQYRPSFHPDDKEGYIYLTTHNYKADEINSKALHRLPGRGYLFNATVEGDFSEYSYPVEYSLELKKGAQVMFVKNDPSGEQRYFNGKIGTICDLSHNRIMVAFNDGSPSVSVEKYVWENKKYTLNKETNMIDEQIIGTFTHYPIKLAWAITVHKSQGLTFEKAIIDVARAFAPGQIYVALSRLTSLEGLVLTSPMRIPAEEQDSSLKEFTEKKENYDTLEELFKKESHHYIVSFVLKSFDFKPLCSLFNYHVESYNKDEKKSGKQKYLNWAKGLQADLAPVKEVAEKFICQLKEITDNHTKDYLTILHKRVIAAKGYFEPILKGFSNRIFTHIVTIQSEKKIKTYLNELREVEILFFKQQQCIYKSEALIGAALQNRELSKKVLYNSSLSKDRKAYIRECELPRPTKNSMGIKKTVSKEEKPNTREISYALFQAGKSIKEIAQERTLVESTIEGHLAHYVAQGEIEVSRFVDERKIKLIIDTSQKLDTTRLSPIKEVLGEKITYSDIRFVLAGYAYQQSRKEKN